LPTNNQHVGEADLEGYSMRALSPEASARTEEHFLICGSCRGRLVEADDYVAAMKTAARDLPRQMGAPEPMRWKWRWPRLIPAFAAVAITIAMVAVPLTRHATPVPFAVSLRTERGPATPARAPSRRPLRLQLDLAGLAASPSYRIEMVDQSAHRVWQGAIANPAAAASVTVPPQKQGMYFVRVAMPSGETVREYGLEVRGTD
jgi:hypothetical protein